MAPVNGNTEERPCHCMVVGCCCCYDSINCEDLVIGCINSGDCLCCRHSCCIAVGAKALGCGMTTKEDECCKIGMYCCDCGLVSPTRCCAHAEACLCLEAVASLPFDDDYVPECVCAYYGIVCAPSCGCCSAPPPCKALKTLHKGEMLAPPPIQAQKQMER